MIQPQEAKLVRGIRRWDLVGLAINGIIGAGIFGLPSKVFALIGPYSLFAFAACALVVGLIILCFCEVSSRYSATGGPYLYTRDAFGHVAGFEIGWLVWLARLSAFAANLNLLVGYLGFFFPKVTIGIPRASIIIFVVVTLTFVNVVGVREAAVTSNIFTIGKLIPIILFIAAGMFFIAPENYSLAVQPTVGNFSKSVLLLVYAFTGFEMAVIPAGEAADPRRNLPRALLIALAVVAVVYVLIQVVCVGTLPELATSEKPLADAGSKFLGTAGGAIISAGALISIFGNLNVLLLSGSRVIYAIADKNELPKLFATTHSKYKTPHNAIIATAIIMLVVAISGTFIYAATISTLARLVVYGSTCVALPLLRRKEGVEPALFKAPLGNVVALFSLGLVIWLLSHSTLREARDTAIAAAVGLIIYLVYRAVKK
jgi:amino acid transporter